MSDPVELEVPGGHLVGERWPGPGPTVLFVHSGVADSRMWTAVTTELAGKADLLGYDRRGYGASPRGPERGSHLGDLVDLVDARLPGGVVVVGCSLGGALALDLALLRPDRVLGLVLLAPTVSGAPDPDDLDASTLVLGRRLSAAIEDGDIELVARLQAWLWLDGPEQAEGRVTGHTRRLFLDMARRAAETGAKHNDDDAPATWGHLDLVTAPTVVGAGDLDVPSVQTLARQLAQRLPDAELVGLGPTARHAAMEDPHQVAGMVTTLLDRLPTG